MSDMGFDCIFYKSQISLGSVVVIQCWHVSCQHALCGHAFWLDTLGLWTQFAI